MHTITDAQVEVAFDAYWAVVSLEGDESRKPMRAALEAYERVRDVERIFDTSTEAIQGRVNQVQIREDDARVEQALESLRHKVREGYQR